MAAYIPPTFRVQQYSNLVNQMEAAMGDSSSIPPAYVAPLQQFQLEVPMLTQQLMQTGDEASLYALGMLASRVDLIMQRASGGSGVDACIRSLYDSLKTGVSQSISQNVTALCKQDPSFEGKLYGALYHVCNNNYGSHGDFGRVAFHDQCGFTVPLEKKQEAFNLALIQHMQELLGQGKEAEAAAFLKYLPATACGEIFKNTWVVMGKPMGIHNDYGQVGVKEYGNPSSPTHVPLSKKQAALKQTYEERLGSYKTNRPSTLPVAVAMSIPMAIPVAGSFVAAAAPAAPMMTAGPARSAFSPVTASMPTATPAAPMTTPAEQALSSRAKKGYIDFYDHTDPQTEFLGNFYRMNVTVKGQTYQCAEGAFQAQKFTDTTFQREFTSVDGDGAFRLGRTRHASFRRDWEQVKDGEMLNVLRVKFSDPRLKGLLLATGSSYLVEHNAVVGRDKYWSDNCDGTGQNKLGILLMQVRGELGGAGIVAKPAELAGLYGTPVSAAGAAALGGRACPIQGCGRPAFVETSGKVHECCSQLHANMLAQMRSRGAVAAPAPAPAPLAQRVCRLQGCQESVYPGFDYCGQTHGRAAQANPHLKKA